MSTPRNVHPDIIELRRAILEGSLERAKDPTNPYYVLSQAVAVGAYTKILVGEGRMPYPISVEISRSVDRALSNIPK